MTKEEIEELRNGMAYAGNVSRKKARNDKFKRQRESLGEVEGLVKPDDTKQERVVFEYISGEDHGVLIRRGVDLLLDCVKEEKLYPISSPVQHKGYGVYVICHEGPLYAGMNVEDDEIIIVYAGRTSPDGDNDSFIDNDGNVKNYKDGFQLRSRMATHYKKIKKSNLRGKKLLMGYIVVRQQGDYHTDIHKDIEKRLIFEETPILNKMKGFGTHVSKTESGQKKTAFSTVNDYETNATKDNDKSDIVLQIEAVNSYNNSKKNRNVRRRVPIV